MLTFTVIADFSIAILVLIPEGKGLIEIVYPMGLMSAVIFFQSIFLLVADRIPIENKWISDLRQLCLKN